MLTYVKLVLSNVFKASSAAFKAGIARAKSRSQSSALTVTTFSISITLACSAPAASFSLLTFAVSVATIYIQRNFFNNIFFTKKPSNFNELISIIIFLFKFNFLCS
jgi:hypothetical protein